MKKFAAVLLVLLSFVCATAQEERNAFLYKGSIDRMPVTMYLVENVTGCPTSYYYGIYKYDRVNKWLLLEIEYDQFHKMGMVENGITGFFSLTKKSDTLEGVWMSPDGKRVFKVQLKEVGTTSKSREQYEEALDKAMYEANGC